MAQAAERIRTLSVENGEDGCIGEKTFNRIFSPEGNQDECLRSLASWLYYGGESVFLQDADSLIMKTDDLADVIASLRVPEELNAEKAKTKEVITVLFQNLQVLAVGALFKPAGGMELYENRQKSKSVNVTLAVSPEEAALLTFAETNGKLQLSLRSPTEQDRQLLQVASWDTLAEYILDKQGTDLRVLGEPQEEPPAPAQKPEEKKEEKPKSNIQIFRAGKEL